MRKLAAVGFDLGDTLCEYAGVPLNWEGEYPAALAAVAQGCRLELSAERSRSGDQVLSRYNTRRTPRPDDQEYPAELIFHELLTKWGAPRDLLDQSISAFFGHFRQSLRAFPESTTVVTKLQQRGVSAGVLTDVPYGMPRSFVVSDVSRAGLPIRDDRIITSSDVGFRKPHPAGFAALARRLDTSCARLMYVGNERKDGRRQRGWLLNGPVVALARRPTHLGASSHHSLPR